MYVLIYEDESGVMKRKRILKTGSKWTALPISKLFFPALVLC
jgi:hypothetical protein